MVSTQDFDSCCSGSSPDESTNFLGLIIKLVGKITHQQLLIAHKSAGMAEQADALDLGSRNWGFDSLFPYNLISEFKKMLNKFKYANRLRNSVITLHHQLEITLKFSDGF